MRSRLEKREFICSPSRQSAEPLYRADRNGEIAEERLAEERAVI